MTCSSADVIAEWEAQAREAGWLPPGDVRFRVWCAHNLNRESCRWCGARRLGVDLRPHRPGCRFFAGPVTHKAVNGHQGTFDWWIICRCGKSYPLHDAEGNEQKECPDAALTHREPQAEDLTAAA